MNFHLCFIFVLSICLLISVDSFKTGKGEIKKQKSIKQRMVAPVMDVALASVATTFVGPLGPGMLQGVQNVLLTLGGCILALRCWDTGSKKKISRMAEVAHQ
jgi:hypothetical protein